MKITIVKSWEQMLKVLPGEFYLFIDDTIEDAVEKVEGRGIEVKEVFVFGKQIRIAKVQK